MDLEYFRDYCLSLGEVEEKMPFGKFARRYETLLVFYVMGHMFCFFDIEDFSWINIRLTPDEICMLKDRYEGIGMPVNQNMKYWVRLSLDSDIPQSDILRLTARAFEVIKDKYTKKSKK